MTSSSGSIAALWRFPVKSMLGERLERAEISEHGIPGDRAFALFDRETGKRVSAVNVRRFPELFSFRATYARAPKAGEPLPQVIIELPNGDSVESDDPGVHEAISAHLSHEVTLERAEGGGAHHDAFPVSVLSNSTLRRMEELQPQSVFDARRFRMNVILDCAEAGFPEHGWVGKSIGLGHDVRLEITQHDARCIMTTLAQDELPNDRTILAGLVKHNRLPVGDSGRYPCAGVYARVTAHGAIAVGDPLSVGE